MPKDRDGRTNVGLNMSPNDKNVSINHSEHNFVFTKKWFRNRNQTTWSTYLPNRYNNRKPYKMLQIGVWEGADLIWCLQNIMKHPGSRITTIDPWLEMLPRHNQDEMDKVCERAILNLTPYIKKISIIKGKSQDILPKLDSNSFDFIVVDGMHTQDAVISDGVEAMRLAKKGAWILFDDVRNARRRFGDVFDGLKELKEIYKDKWKLVWQHRHCDCYEKVKG